MGTKWVSSIFRPKSAKSIHCWCPLRPLIPYLLWFVVPRDIKLFWLHRFLWGSLQSHLSLMHGISWKGHWGCTTSETNINIHKWDKIMGFNGSFCAQKVNPIVSYLGAVLSTMHSSVRLLPGCMTDSDRFGKKHLSSVQNPSLIPFYWLSSGFPYWIIYDEKL